MTGEHTYEIQRIVEQLATVADRLGSAVERLVRVEERYSGLLENMNRIDKRVSAVETTNQHTAVQIAKIVAYLTVIGATITAFGKDIVNAVSAAIR